MSALSVDRMSAREGKKTPAKHTVVIRPQDVVASLSLVALSATVLALVFESMVP